VLLGLGTYAANRQRALERLSLTPARRLPERKFLIGGLGDVGNRSRRWDRQPHPARAFKLNGRILAELHELWVERSRKDEYLGTLVNAWLARSGRAQGVRAGEAYVDVGTLHGYRRAIQLLA